MSARPAAIGCRLQQVRFVFGDQVFPRQSTPMRGREKLMRAFLSDESPTNSAITSYPGADSPGDPCQGFGYRPSRMREILFVEDRELDL